MVKILRDIKPSKKNDISLEEIKEDLKRKKRDKILLKNNSQKATGGIHKRGKSHKDKAILDFDPHRSFLPTKTKNQSHKTTWFDKQKNLFQLAAAGTIIVLIINIFSVIVSTSFLKEDVSYSAYQGYQELVEGGENILQTNFSNAFQAFEDAQKQFERIDEELWFLKDDPVLTSDSKLQDGGRLIKVGEVLSESGKLFTQGFQEIQKAAQLFFAKENSLVAEFEEVEKRASITDALSRAASSFEEAQLNLEESAQLIAEVDEELYPSEYRSKVKTAQLHLSSLIGYLDKINAAFPAALKMLGDKHHHTYLILFHNSNELRPILGFIGSYAVVDVDEGYIEQIKIHDVYELDGQFYEEIPDIPQEIKEIAGALKMRDSNYSPDASVSLAKSAWFYQKQGGKSVDTVISIDQNILGQILHITGPLHIEGLNAPITAENYDFIVSYIVESKLYGASNPKAVLNDIFTQISSKLTQQQYHAQTLELLISMIKNQKLLAYSKDQDIQNLFQKLELTGELSKWQEGSDGLQIIRSSIGGNKSDKYIKHNYTHKSYIAHNGEVINQVKIELQHNWHRGIMREWNRILDGFGFTEFNDTVKDILGRGKNRSGIRVYVPKGSEFLDVIGLSKDQVKKHYDKTIDREYFYFELSVTPQNAAKISIEYKLPFKLNTSEIDTYKFYYEPQIGAKNVKLNKIVRGDVGLKNYKNFPEQELSPAQTIEYTVNGTKSQYFSGIWGN